MSRYEPPIPVKEKEKQEALEKVREITNGGSKESKSEKPVEGNTDLSWDHEGLEPHPKPGEPKSLRDPKPPRVPKTETKEEYVFNVRGTMMKGTVQNSYLKREKRSLHLLNQ